MACPSPTPRVTWVVDIGGGHDEVAVPCRWADIVYARSVRVGGDLPMGNEANQSTTLAPTAHNLLMFAIHRRAYATKSSAHGRMPDDGRGASAHPWRADLLNGRAKGKTRNQAKRNVARSAGRTVSANPARP